MTEGSASDTTLTTLADANALFKDRIDLAKETLSASAARLTEDSVNDPMRMDQLIVMLREETGVSATWVFAKLTDVTKKDLTLMCAGASAAFTSQAALILVRKVVQSFGSDAEDGHRTSTAMVKDAWGATLGDWKDSENFSCSVVQGEDQGVDTEGFKARMVLYYGPAAGEVAVMLQQVAMFNSNNEVLNLGDKTAEALKLAFPRLGTAGGGNAGAGAGAGASASKPWSSGTPTVGHNYSWMRRV